VWQTPTPETVAAFAGVPFFFARELHRKLAVPVGIVQLAVPGAPIELFLSADRAEKLHALLGYPAKAESASLYNGMIAPAAPFAARGFLWWQGEANAARWTQYRVLFPALIEDWRRAWDAPEMPFLFVELANFLQLQTRPVEDDTWPALRDAQLSGLALKHVWQVSAIDVIGPGENPMNIHPPDKQLVAHRLYRTAMANVYGETDLVWSGPRFRSVRLEGSRAVVAFDHADGGLKAKDGQPLKGFAVAGEDRRFAWADARIEGATVELVCPEVAEPVAVRYAWANNPVGTLVNGEGLPAFPFRTDDWDLCVKPEKE
jgi:sialate O-acetylesterase